MNKKEKTTNEFNAMVFSGNSNCQFAEKIANYLGASLGKSLAMNFSDGENYVEIKASVRGHEVFLIQSISPPSSANNLMELLIFIDALKRASASAIIAVIPYFGYARQDRRPYSARVPITAKLVANMLTVAGADRIVTIDLHAEQIQGFFDIPVDNLYAAKVFTADIKASYSDSVIVSPDVGGVVRARAIAKILNTDFAIVDKRRPRPNVSEVMNIIGEVKGRNCIVVDDIIDTAGTLCKAAEALKEQGATNVIAYCTHPIFSGNALENIKNSVLTEVVVSDTIPLSSEVAKLKVVRRLSIANLVAESMRRIHFGESVSEIFPKILN